MVYLIKSRTIYDLSLLFGRRGTTNDNLIVENFVEIGLSKLTLMLYSL